MARRARRAVGPPLLAAVPGSRVKRPVLPILEVICAAREPLTEPLLASATGLDVRKDFPQRGRLLAQFLSARTAPSGETTIAPFHKSLIDWLTHADTVHSVALSAEVESKDLRLRVPTELERHQRQQYRFAGSRRSDHQRMSNIADVERKAKRGGPFRPGQEQGRRLEMVVPRLPGPYC